MEHVVYCLCGQSSLGSIHPFGSLVFKGGCTALLSLKFPAVAPKRDKYEIWELSVLLRPAK